MNSRMRPMETYFTSGWHAGMCLVCKNDTPDDLDKVFDAVTYPNANYQLKIGEGPATRNASSFVMFAPQHICRDWFGVMRAGMCE